MSSSASIRYKQRGAIHTLAWRELAIHEHGSQALDWVRGLAVAQAAPVSWSADDVLWLEPELAEQDPRWVGAWQVSGAALAVAEARDSGDADRRELAPTVLLARGAWYDALAADTLARVQRADRLTRGLVKWALRGKPGFVSRALADQLGLARVRRAICVGSPGAEARSLFAALGIELGASSEEASAVALFACEASS